MAKHVHAKSITWVGEDDGFLRLLDQTRLPGEVVFHDCHDVQAVWEAIRTLRVRGAPAIGVAAAYGVVLGLRGTQNVEVVTETVRHLATSRPTAVNLFWALERIQRVAFQVGDASELRRRLWEEARTIHQEDVETCLAIGRHGADLLQDGMGVQTHCNAGALATADFGTALAPIFVAAEQGKRLHVYVDETRPLLQGSRLTAWELQQRGIPCTVLCDNAAAQVQREGRVQVVLVGADRIAANGDTANKIGTYGLAILAAHHGVPFYVAAPRSTFDLALADGSGIPIEQRPTREVTHGFGPATAPDGVGAYNPAFDVTPAAMIRGIITEAGIVAPVAKEPIHQAVGSSVVQSSPSRRLE